MQAVRASRSPAICCSCGGLGASLGDWTAQQPDCTAPCRRLKAAALCNHVHCLQLVTRPSPADCCFESSPEKFLTACVGGRRWLWARLDWPAGRRRRGALQQCAAARSGARPATIAHSCRTSRCCAAIAAAALAPKPACNHITLRAMLADNVL
jgi:hypothetical protein